VTADDRGTSENGVERTMHSCAIVSIFELLRRHILHCNAIITAKGFFADVPDVLHFFSMFLCVFPVDKYKQYKPINKKIDFSIASTTLASGMGLTVDSMGKIPYPTVYLESKIIAQSSLLTLGEAVHTGMLGRSSFLTGESQENPRLVKK